jgi:cytochrome c-type biogenesis protein CcsB
MELPFFAAVIVLYLVATAGFVAHLTLVRETPRRIGLASLALAFAIDTVAITVRIGNVGMAAVNTFHDQLSVLTWLTVGVYLLLQIRYQLAVLGALVSPVAFLLTLSSYVFYSGAERLPEGLQSAWLPAHVALAFLGYAVFALAFCVSLVYLLQDRQLKGKRRGIVMFRRLPSLETLDEINYRCVAWGFALFTVGILTGSLLAKMTFGEFWSWEPVQVLSTLAWLLYALQLQTRAVGWRGRKAAALTIVGFALLVVSFLSFNLGFPGRHTGTLG